MPCDRCDESRENGYRFCVKCGESLSQACGFCSEYESKGYRYCVRCGRRLRAEEPEDTAPVVLNRSPLIAMPFILALIVIELAAMFIWFGDAWAFTDTGSVNWYTIVPELITLVTVTGTGLKVWWIALILASIASAAYAVYRSKDLFLRGRPMALKERTPLYWFFMMFGACLILNMAAGIVLAALGYPIDVPEWIETMTMGEALVTFANAGVSEEIASRVLLIGLPFAVYALLRKRKDGLRYLLGGTGIGKVSVILIVVSALFFGLAHASGWGLSKVIPTFISGLFMGYLYCRFGLYASILFHFTTDYLSVLILGLGATPIGLILIIVILVGVLCLAEAARRLFLWFKKGRNLPLDDLDQRSP